MPPPTEKITCPKCKGRGFKSGSFTKKCKLCDGKGIARECRHCGEVRDPYCSCFQARLF